MCVTNFVFVIGAPARPAARAVELAAAQPPAPRAHWRPRLFLPALGVAPRRAALCPPPPPLRAAIAMRCRRGIHHACDVVSRCVYVLSLSMASI